MAGVPGKTNNPKGRPLGAINKLARENYTTLHKLLEDNYEKMEQELKKLKGLAFVRLYADLMKVITPSAPPIVAEEEDGGSGLEERVLQEGGSAGKDIW
jgi:hypothetical protein